MQQQIKHKYKNTLKISSTEFPMKADLVKNSEKYRILWTDNNIYEKRLKKNKLGKDYVLIDGPPYANGQIHIGHALNKILKDFIVRQKMMDGYNVDYCPGWDCHGLPIENAIERRQKEKYSELNNSQKRDMCRDFAMLQVETQIFQMQQLHLFSNFKKKYLTLDHDYQINEINVILKLIEKKLLYWDLKPVFWSWSSKTTLAESEIIYKEIEETSIYFYFSITDSKNSFFHKARLIVWTTTPYTLEANLAILLNPQKTYVVFEYNNHKYICIQTKFDEILSKFGWIDAKSLHTFEWKDLSKEKYFNPITKETCPILAASFVDDDSGTGIVHCAPGFGNDDYKVGYKNNLKIYCPINENGHFHENCKFPGINGLFYKKASKVVIEWLEQNEHLLKSENIFHKVGHDWRTKQPTLFRATKQWFLNIKEIKTGLKASFKELNAWPDWLGGKLKNIILDREEWCLSRQRKWGTIIPILFLDEDPILDPKQIKHTISVLDQEGMDCWHVNDAEFFLLNNGLLSEKKAITPTNLKKSSDILDVWFDSGCAFLHNNRKQADVYLEGFDQLRGWFNSSSIICYILKQELPFKKLIGHGFVLDGKGNKMSKSLGNVIDPLEIVNKWGADILRLWVALNNYQEDIRVNQDSFEQTATHYKKIRNTIFRYSLSIINNENIDQSVLKNLKFPENQYIYSTFCEHFNIALKEIDDFCYFKSLRAIFNFINIYSNWYLEISKDSLYCDSVQDARRIEIVNIIYNIFYKSLIFFSIFIPQTSEEAYSHFEMDNKKESVFMEEWLNPEVCNYKIDTHFWESFLNLKKQIYSAIEIAKNNKEINLITESSVTMNKKIMIDSDISQLIKYLNIAELHVSESTDAPDVVVTKTTLPFCERCKRFNSSNKKELCERCYQIIANWPK